EVRRRVAEGQALLVAEGRPGRLRRHRREIECPELHHGLRLVAGRLEGRELVEGPFDQAARLLERIPQRLDRAGLRSLAAYRLDGIAQERERMREHMAANEDKDLGVIVAAMYTLGELVPPVGQCAYTPAHLRRRNA